MRRAAILILFIALCSCSPRIYERVIYQHDTTYVSKWQVDSVYKRDSVYIREKADTVYQYVERIRERYKFIHDTTLVTKVDSVAYETIKEVKVEKPLTWWQRFRLKAFGWLVVAVLACLVWIFRKPLLSGLKEIFL